MYRNPETGRFMEEPEQLTGPELLAVNTTVARNQFNRGFFGWLNLYLSSMTGVAVGGVLTIAGDLAMTVTQVRPNNVVQCRITGVPHGKGHNMPMGKGRLIIRTGDTVTG